jgi:hypothetical protein
MIRSSDGTGERLDVGRVGELGIGHDRRRVRVHEHDAEALFAQHAARLGAGVVELARLADDDRATPDQEDGLEVGTAGHRQPARMRIDELAERGSAHRADRGPASGWYWHAERMQVVGAHAFEIAVVQIEVTDGRAVGQ